MRTRQCSPKCPLGSALAASHSIRVPSPIPLLAIRVQPPLLSWCNRVMQANNLCRLAFCFVLVGLIGFSSTMSGGVRSDAAYRFYYNKITRLLGHAAPAHLHLVAEKGVHFLLFFPLGFWIYKTSALSNFRRLWPSIVVCVAVGIASECIQRFTGRDPLVDDAVLNACSGIFGAFIAMRARSKTDLPGCSSPDGVQTRCPLPAKHSRA